MTNSLKTAVEALALSMGSELGPENASAVDKTLEEFELDSEDKVAGWLVQVLTDIANGETHQDWVQFDIAGLDSSDSLEFTRLLGEWLPIEVRNEGERWTIRSERLPSEAIITFEGSSYMTKPRGSPEPGEGIVEPGSCEA
ncbi:MAG: hypothetical protein ACI8QC_003493 [Planctomycetota bacterium]|jgi:hypothetical protein